MTAAERVKEALHLLELVDDELRGHEGEYDFAHSILQDAVYCQKVVNTIVWRLNKLNNPGLEPPYEYIRAIRCKECKHKYVSGNGTTQYYVCDFMDAQYEEDGFCHHGRKE